MAHAHPLQLHLIKEQEKSDLVYMGVKSLTSYIKVHVKQTIKLGQCPKKSLKKAGHKIIPLEHVNQVKVFTVFGLCRIMTHHSHSCL